MKRILARRPTVAIAALVTVVSLVACGGSGNPLSGAGGSGEGGEPIVVGSANFPESVLLMEIYAEALRQAGAEVQTSPRLGTRVVTNQALQDGSISVIPEYTGNLLQSFDADFTATAPQDVYEALQQKLPEGLQVLEYSQAQDSDVLVVTRETSERFGLTSMAQLGPRCGQFVLGAAQEWPQRWAQSIADIYGCRFQRIISTDAAGPVTLEALRSGEADVVNLFTTSPDIEANGWVELADPERMYPAQNIVPLVRSGVLDQAEVNALNKVSAALTTERLTELNRRVTEQRAVPADLAKEFVGSLGP